jgi:hypothetical protein
MPIGSIKKIVFGSDLDPKIKNKLIARQHSAGKDFYGSNPEFVEESPKKKPANIKEALGGAGRINFSQDDNPILDLSSRTPFIRMWTCVQLYYFDAARQIGVKPEKTGHTMNDLVKMGLGGQMISKYGAREFGRLRNTKKGRKEIIKTSVAWTPEWQDDQAEDIRHDLDRKVYVVGNNVLNILDETDPTAPIISHTDTPKTIIQGSPELTNELQSNDYFNPPALISSISSDTEGDYGAIKRTTVNFKVFNFNDFEQIYSKYFLNPGAQIIVDFGWDTTNLYNPSDLVDSDKLEKLKRGNSFDQVLFGPDGYLEENRGDLEIIMGHVVSFDSKVQSDGSFECTIELISKNAALVDHSFSEADSLKSTFVNGLNPYLINLVANTLGTGDQSYNFLRNNWRATKENLAESTAYANTFAQSAFGNVESKDVSITHFNLKTGIYWQALDSKNTISDNKNLYVMWGFVEDQLLNKELSIGLNKVGSTLEDIELGNLSCEFDSSETYVRFDKNLDMRQNFETLGKNTNKTSLKFLYPPKWDETYNTMDLGYEQKGTAWVKKAVITTRKAKVPSIREEELNKLNLARKNDKLQPMTATDLDKGKNRVPFRDVFINTSVISEGFMSKDTVNDAILYILDEISKDSAQVFDLKLISPDLTNTKLRVVDANMSAMDDDSDKDEEGGGTDNIFTFEINSDKSIVKELDLTFQSPKGGSQDMIAIQNSSGKVPLVIDDSYSDSQNSMRTLNADGQYFAEYIPSHGSDDIKTKQIKKIITPALAQKQNSELEVNAHHKIKLDQYQDIMTNLQKAKQESDTQFNLSDNVINKDRIKKYIPGIDKFGSEEEVWVNKNFVDTIEDYYKEKARTNYFSEISTPLLYIEASISIYGISGIVPGNIFKLSYIPNPWRDKVFFQIKKVSHSVDTDSWTTSFETIMKMKRKVKSEYGALAWYKQNIQLSNKFLNNIGHTEYGSKFTDIKMFSLSDIKIVSGNVKVKIKDPITGHCSSSSTSGNIIRYNFKPDLVLSMMAIDTFEWKLSMTWLWKFSSAGKCSHGGLNKDWKGNQIGSWILYTTRGNRSHFLSSEIQVSAGDMYYLIIKDSRYFLLPTVPDQGFDVMSVQEFCDSYPLLNVGTVPT